MDLEQHLPTPDGQNDQEAPVIPNILGSQSVQWYLSLQPDFFPTILATCPAEQELQVQWLG